MIGLHVDDDFAVELELEAQHAVGGRVLRPHVDVQRVADARARSSWSASQLIAVAGAIDLAGDGEVDRLGADRVVAPQADGPASRPAA